MSELLNILREHKIIADGAFGTYFQSKYGDNDNVAPERANLTDRSKVVAIHKDYIAAGARLIRTNTFASNTISLGMNFMEVLANVRNAVAAARTAVRESFVRDKVFIAGDIGPIPKDSGADHSQIVNEYMAIADIFIEEKLDIILFETQAELSDILPVIHHIKEVSDMPVWVQFSVNQFGYSNAGLSARKLWELAAADDDIDGIGLNCGIGPAHMEKILKTVNLDCGKFVSVLPNAGYPKLFMNRLTFSNNIGYFSEKAGVFARMGADVIGGCCGTAPANIEDIRRTVSLQHNDKVKTVADQTHEAFDSCDTGLLSVRKNDPTHKIIAVELVPPVNADDEKLLDAANILKNAGADVVTFPDSPSGRTRADAVLMAEKVKNETGLRVMPHICCRDKNAIAIRATILGARLNGIEDFLVITGDPVPVMIRQTTKSVFNFDSIGMMNIISDMNEEILKSHRVSYGGAINHNRVNLNIEIERVKKKMKAGATFFLSQPVFSAGQAEILKGIKEQTGAVILVGVMPLVSRRNAMFMKSEMSGINIPDEVINRYPEDGSREEGEAVGVALAKDIMAATDSFADGYYFSFPFNRVGMLKKIMG